MNKTNKLYKHLKVLKLDNLNLKEYHFFQGNSKALTLTKQLTNETFKSFSQVDHSTSVLLKYKRKEDAFHFKSTKRLNK